MKLINVFVLTSLTSGFFLLFIFAFWWVYPYKPITFKDKVLPILNENKTVKSGGYLQISLDYCKYTTEIPLVTRTFVDDVLYDISPMPVSQKPIGCAVMTLQIYVPKGLPLGAYSLKNVYHYHPNPIRYVDVPIDTEMFTVIK